jgi:hypothetical protein
MEGAFSMTQDKKPSTPETLIKSSKQGSVELSEQSLEKATGGITVRKAGEKPVEYLKVSDTTSTGG